MGTLLFRYKKGRRHKGEGPFVTPRLYDKTELQNKTGEKMLDRTRLADLVCEVERHRRFERFLVEDGAVHEGHQQGLFLGGPLGLLPHRKPHL